MTFFQKNEDRYIATHPTQPDIQCGLRATNLLPNTWNGDYDNNYENNNISEAMPLRPVSEANSFQDIHEIQCLTWKVHYRVY
jgi:hypothetical protein